MSAAQSGRTLTHRVGALQCHFTWDLDPVSNKKWFRLKLLLLDIKESNDQKNPWLGHIHNLLGYAHFRLGSAPEASSSFEEAEEVLRRNRGDPEGPWLLVNYGNRARLHHHEGSEEQSLALLSKVEALMEKYPPPPEEALQAEVCAEKAWTLMTFDRERRLEADRLFLRALRMEPDRREWRSSRVIGLVQLHKDKEAELKVETLREAQELDPENLFLHVLYLTQLARENPEAEGEAEGEAEEPKKQEDRAKREAANLVPRILREPPGNYGGLKPLLRFYKDFFSLQEALDLALEAAELHPQSLFVKRCLALAYMWRILFVMDEPAQSLIDQGIRVHQDLISLVPDASLLKKMDLADIYARFSRTRAQSEHIYQELLDAELEPEDRQVLYNRYARYLFFAKKQPQRSLYYHKRAAEIPHESLYRQNSIDTLKKNWDRDQDQEIRDFLSRLNI